MLARPPIADLVPLARLRKAADIMASECLTRTNFAEWFVLDAWLESGEGLRERMAQLEARLQ